MRVNWRLCFSRQGPAVWLAHLDQMRTFERAVRRAHIPVLYSRGFNPRPQLAFALPAGVGLASVGDLLDVRLDGDQPPDETQRLIWMDRLNQALPQGLAVLDSFFAPDDRHKSLMSRVVGAGYCLDVPGIAAAMTRLKETRQDKPWLVERAGKRGRQTIDLKPLILSMDLVADQMTLLVSAGSQKNMRPELVLALLVAEGLLSRQAAEEATITRTALWFSPEHLKAAQASQKDWVRLFKP